MKAMLVACNYTHSASRPKVMHIWVQGCTQLCLAAMLSVLVCCICKRRAYAAEFSLTEELHAHREALELTCPPFDSNAHRPCPDRYVTPIQQLSQLWRAMTDT